jgi:hypothetical protein
MAILVSHYDGVSLLNAAGARGLTDEPPCTTTRSGRNTYLKLRERKTGVYNAAIRSACLNFSTLERAIWRCSPESP